MRKKLISMILSTVMVASIFTGCGNKSTTVETSSADSAATQSTTTEKKDSNEEVTLRFSWWGGDERLAATLAVIDQFQELHPNIKIEAEYGSSDGYTDKLATQLAAGTAADIIQVDPEAFPNFVTENNNYFVDLNDYNFDFSNFEESYYKLRVNGCYDGHQYGIPTGIAGPALLINQDLADAVGIDFSTQYSWDDLITWGKKVREYDNSMYLICANKEYVTNFVLFNYAKQLTGKSLIDEETKELTLSQEDLNQIYAYIKALYDNEVIAPASYIAAYENDNLQSDPNWISGKYVTAFAYISTIEVMTAANTAANYTVGKLPLLDGAKNAGFSCNCPQVLGVSNQSAHIEEAVEFLDYFFNNETAMETLGTVRSVPPTQKAREICEKNGSLNALLSESANLASEYGGVSNDKYSSVQESKQILYDHVEAIGYGAVSVEDATTDTLDLMNNYIGSIQ